jgi:hypothetical protein
MGANSSVIPYLCVPVYDRLHTSRRPILSFSATLTMPVYDLLQTSWRPIPPFPTFLSNLFYDLFQTFTPRNRADPGRIFRQALPVLYSRAGAYSAAKNARNAHPHSPLRYRSKIAANRESQAHMRVAVTTVPCNVARRRTTAFDFFPEDSR